MRASIGVECHGGAMKSMGNSDSNSSTEKFPSGGSTQGIASILEDGH